MPKIVKLESNPLHTETVLQLTRKVKRNTEATWDHYLHISPDTSHYMEAVFSMVREIYGKPPGDLVTDLNVNLAIWGMFMNTTLRAAFDLGKDYDTNLRFVKELSLENNGTAFQGNRKAGQWSGRNHLHEHDQFSRFVVGIGKLIAQSSLSIFHKHCLCLLRLCALHGKNGRRSC